MAEACQVRWTKEFTEVTQRRQYFGKAAREAVRRMTSPTGLIVEGELLRRLQDQGFFFDPNVTNKSVYKPDDLFPCLERYFGAAEFNPDERKLGWAVQYARKVFGRSSELTLKPLNLDVSILNALKRLKSAGLPSLEKKGDAFKADLSRAIRIAEGKRAPDPCMAYHRIQHGESGPKTRLVWGYPQSMTILESLFARPLINHFLDYTRTPIAFGWWRTEVAAKLMVLENSGVRYSFDYSKFDSSLPAKLIDASFEILRTWFDFNEAEEEVWDKVVNYFIHTPILMPDGFVYMKHRGVASGSYFTQLVGSIANFIATQYMALSVFHRTIDVDKILLLGDDIIFGYPDLVPMHKFAVVCKQLGMTINEQKSVISLFGEQGEFLGHTWKRGVVDRKPEEIAKRIAFPETHVKLSKDDRLEIRPLAYLSDAISSWPIIKSLVVYQGSMIECYLQIKSRALYFPVTGYQVYKESVDVEKGVYKARDRFRVGRADILK